jgi:hypothetical protein
MKKQKTDIMKRLMAMITVLACNDPDSSETVRPDSIPTVKPDTLDTSRVITPPPTGDSNVVYPDSSVESK